MIASHDGACVCGCGEKIAAGTEIRLDEDYGWIKAGHPKQVEVCQSCFMAKAANGTCGCDD